MVFLFSRKANTKVYTHIYKAITYRNIYKKGIVYMMFRNTYSLCFLSNINAQKDNSNGVNLATSD